MILISRFLSNVLKLFHSLTMSGDSTSNVRPMQDPAHYLFSILQKKRVIEAWIVDSRQKFEGNLVGIDEYMNLLIEDPIEVTYSGDRKNLGKKLLLRGESLSLIRPKA